MSERSSIFHAGYILPTLLTQIPKACAVQDLDVRQAVYRLSHFVLEDLRSLPRPVEKAPDHIDFSHLKVLYNQLLRGTPTYLPYDIEQAIALSLEGLREGNVGFEVTSEQLVGACWYALHPIDPRVNRASSLHDYRQSWEQLDSRAEVGFLFQDLASRLYTGEGDFLLQLFEPQRSLDTMVDDPKVRAAMQNNFKEQRADFVLEFPYPDPSGQRGICVEVDGPHHNESLQKSLDARRDAATQASNWHPTIRFPVHEFGTAASRKKFKQIQTLLDQHPAIALYRQNYAALPDRNAMQLALSPFGIARVQFALLRAILSGQLDLNQPVWHIGVLEHDVPCAYLAVEQVQTAFANLSRLSGCDFALPDIQLEVFVTEEFKEAELNAGRRTRPMSDLDYVDSGTFDLFVEVSLLRTPQFRAPTPMQVGMHAVRIHNAYHPAHSHQPFLCGERIPYRPIWDGEREVAEPADALRYFLRNIFRKQDFRPGQVRILNLALQNQHVIGLLPTGGGKSLTYQIAGILQPGHTIVIDPIKSLMKDQVDSLARMGINRTVYINSSLNGDERRASAARLLEGHALFCFISPERMIIPSFRNLLSELAHTGRFFTYGVVDEAHCVSEWGHDFRTPYLALGRNLLRFCIPFRREGGGQEKITLFGLTATASFDVLADVQRELSGQRPGEPYGDEVPDSHIVQHHTTNRWELQYVVEHVNFSTNHIDFDSKYADRDIKKALGVVKQRAIAKSLKRAPDLLAELGSEPSMVVSDDLIRIVSEGSGQTLPSAEEIANQVALPKELIRAFWNQKGANAALVFAPHRSSVFGVTDRYKNPDKMVGIADTLVNHLQPDLTLNIGVYLGASQDDDGGISLTNNGPLLNEDNDRNQTAFLSNKIDVMVATKAFGMGIDKPNIRMTVHSTYPGSIESFVQEAGRAGRDQKMALSVLLYNRDEFQLRVRKKPMNVDRDIQEFFHKGSFPGPRFEKLSLLEILTEIIVPDTQLTWLASELKKRIGFSEDSSPNLRISYSRDHGNLWLNDEDNNAFGYVNLERLRPYLSNKVINSKKAYTYLEVLIQLLVENKLHTFERERLDRWLKSHVDGGRRPGIEAQLAEMKMNETRSLVIPFLNGLPKDDEKCRNKAATDKAVYRLFLIGVIDDYTIDYRGNTYTVTFSKKDPDVYLKYVEHYIAKFYPPRKVQQILEHIPSRKGSSEIQRILNFLVEFLYSEIAKKRYESIRVMQDLCEHGLKEGNVGMKTYIHLYFNSKYARMNYAVSFDDAKAGEYRTLSARSISSGSYNVSLRDWTDRGRLSHPDWVFDFMDIVEDDATGATFDNLKHLRGACTLLLVSNPENATLRLLRAFALLALSEQQTDMHHLVQPIVTDLAVGFRSLQVELDSTYHIAGWVSSYRDALLQKTAESFHPIVEDLLDAALVRMHTDWTQHFAETLEEQLKPYVI